MNHKNIKLLIFSFICSISLAFSQAEFPNIGPVFRDDMVPRIDIQINPDSLAWIYENVESNRLFHAQFVFTTDTLQDTIPEIGFRLRGNTSRNAKKKSFKVSFNTYHPGRKFYGLEKMNLNGEHNDPSIIRSKIGWDLLRQFGIPASRANHVQVYINGDYYGLYINVEHIDEEFVDSRFENQDGNLYKCLWPCDFDYKGSSPEDYKYTAGDRRVYDLRTNTAADDYTDLADFITKLNQLPLPVFACEINKVLNVYDYLRVIAVDVFLGNWDGPIYNKNNCYLYHDTKSDRFEYIPYDLDNILGVDWMGKDWGNRNIYDWNKHGEPRPIYTKMMANQKFREIYSQYMSELISDSITGEALINHINRLKEMISPYVAIDTYYPQDYGFTYQDFLDSYSQELGGHVTYGLIPYIQTRRASAQEQLEAFQQQPVINHIRHKAKNNGADLRIRAYVREQADSVTLVYRENGGETEYLNMFDDGAHFDREANDGVYANTLAYLPLNTSIQYQIQAANDQYQTGLNPCQTIEYSYHLSTIPALVINEFMADNDSIIADEYGDFGDWIEVYNADTVDVYLGDKYLSDHINNPNKWMMPDMILETKDFALFWADGDPQKGERHTNFKLSKNGEEIGIFDSENTGFFPLDTLHFDSQLTNVSQGRYPDGGAEWRLYTMPTPGYTNVFDAMEEQKASEPLLIYPNPNNTGRLYLNKPTDIQIYSLQAQLLIRSENTRELDISKLSSGVYLVQDKDHHIQKLVIP